MTPAQSAYQAANSCVQLWFWIEALYLRTDLKDRQTILLRLHKHVEDLRDAADNVTGSTHGIGSALAGLCKLAENLVVTATAFELPAKNLTSIDCDFRFDAEVARYRRYLAAHRQSFVQAIRTIKIQTDVRAVFELTHLSYSELFPTFGGGQLLEDEVDLLKRLQGPFSGTVRGLLETIPLEIRARVRSDWAVKNFTRDGATGEVQRLIHIIEKAVLQRPEASDDLGLSIDRPGARIGRLGQWVPFPHPSRWGMLEALSEAGDTFITTTALLNTLNAQKTPTTMSDKAAAVTAISDIKKCLHKIDLDIENQRRQGYRLCRFPAPRGRRRELKPTRR